MGRSYRLCLSRSFALVYLCCLITSLASGQVTNVTDTTSTPIKGAGHDYIKGFSETVNPANGSLSVRVQVPVAKGRGLTIPFSFGYDSNAYRHLRPGYYPNFGTVTWVTNTGSVGQGGWIYSLPQLNLDDWTQNVSVLTGYNNGPVYTVYPCQYDGSYVFRDGNGGVHALGLGAAWVFNPGYAQYCASSSTISGGDSQVRAVLTTQSQGNLYQPAPVVVYEPDGTLYYFPSLGVGNQNDTPVYGLPSYIEDRNGNKITVSGTTFTDSVGRTLFSYSGFGPAGHTNTVSVSGINYQVTWKAEAAAYSVSSTWAGTTNGPSSNGCTAIPSVNDSQTVVSQVALPDGQAYKFYYGTDATPNNAVTNPYGLLSEIDYPSGGWVQYTWKPSDTMNEYADYPGLTSTAGTCSTDPTAYCPVPIPGGCGYQYKTPVVASRIVSFNGSSPAQTQTFTYSTTWAAPLSGNSGGITWTGKNTSVNTSDNVLGQSFLTTYSYSPVNAPAPPFSSLAVNQIPVESSVSYYDWGNTTSPERVVTKAWFDQYNLQKETVLENGQTSQTTYCYAGGNCLPATSSFAQLQEKDEYDFGLILSRKTITTYQSFTGTPGVIADEPCKVVIYDGSGNQSAETDYYYDGGTALCGSPGTPSVSAVSGLVTGTHDESNFGSSSSVPRGNLTKKVQWGNTGTSPTTTLSYDETGQVTSLTDPRNNKTLYSYTDNYSSGTPPGNTNAYLTTVTRPTVHGVTTHGYYQYDYSSGQLTVSQDDNDLANGKSTSYTYADPFLRPTQVNYPDGGQTQYKYSDTAPSPTVTTCQLINGTAGATCSSTSPPPGWRTTLATTDGLGHVVQTKLVSDPDGATYTATTYDGLGHPYTVSNPYRSTSDPTYGITTYTYDALGRTILVSEPDGSKVSTAYVGTQTTVTDEAGNERTTQADALGRINRVFEAPNVSGYDYGTYYVFDALNNLTSVIQKGGSPSSGNWRQRSFHYDSLSRLTSASNPESGTISYAYDANGNVITKVAPAPNAVAPSTATVTTSYTYDALNRLTYKSFSDGVTPPVGFGYDESSVWGTAVTNPVGRLTHTSVPANAAWIYSFDPVGRIANAWECTPTNYCGTGSYPRAYSYDLMGNMTSTLIGGGTTISYTYDAAARPIGVNSSYVDSYHPAAIFTADSTQGYYPGGQLHKAKLGNNLTNTAAYNSRLQPCRMNLNSSYAILQTCTDPVPPGNVQDFSYGFNSGSSDNGNLASFTATGITGALTLSRSYTYDPLNRLITMTGSGGVCTGLSETYDAWGNRYNQTPTGGDCSPFGAVMSTAGNNQFVGIYTYDIAGNLTRDGNHTYFYNAENRLIQIDGTLGTCSSATACYVYDAGGQRIQTITGSTVVDFIRDIDGSVAVDNGPCGTSRCNWHDYIYLNGSLLAEYRNGSTYFVHSDHLGSMGLMTSLTQGIFDAIEYQPFGEQASGGTGTSHKFTGKERDAESGLDNFGARYNASSMGQGKGRKEDRLTTKEDWSDFTCLNSTRAWEFSLVVSLSPQRISPMWATNERGKSQRPMETLP